MKTLIKNGTIVDKKNKRISAAIWIEDNKIKAIGSTFDNENFDHVFDAKGQLITPGLIDIHVHLREPGLPIKKQ